MADLHEIETLIAAHASAWLALEAACEVTDAAFGTDKEAAAEEAQAKASDATAEAVRNIIEHPYSSIEELRRGVSYLAGHHRSTGDGDPGEWFKCLAHNLIGMTAGEEV